MGPFPEQMKIWKTLETLQITLKSFKCIKTGSKGQPTVNMEKKQDENVLKQKINHSYQNILSNIPLDFLVCLVLIIMTLSAYWQVAGHQFVYDDVLAADLANLPTNAIRLYFKPLPRNAEEIAFS